MIIGSENVIEWLKLNNTPYWTVYNTGTGRNVDSKVIQTPMDKNNYEMSSSIDLFSRWCKLAGSNGRYYIVAKQDNSEANTKKGVFQDYIEIQAAPVEQAVAGTNYAPSISMDEIEAQISKRVSESLQRIETERELKELRQKVKELEPSMLESRIGSLITMVQPFMPAIMAKMGLAPTGAPSIGTTQIHTSTQTPETMTLEANETDAELDRDITTLIEDQEKLEWAVGILLHYSDVNMLVKLADAVRKKPSLVQTVNAFL